MTEAIQALEKQAAELAAQISAAKTEAKAGAIAAVKAIMADHGLTVADVCGTPSAVLRASASRIGKKVAPKFRNTAGDTWTGRGMKPKWLTAALSAGATVEQFKIAA